MALVLMAKAFKLTYSTPTNKNQRISSNPRNRQIAQPGMNMGQDRQIQMIRGHGGNQPLSQTLQLRVGSLPLPFEQSATEIGKAPIYDLDGTSEVPDSYNCYGNEILNMFTQEEKYTELLEPILEPHQIHQNDNNVIPDVLVWNNVGEP
nr:hypothetical protein [Tanacetum cinerariifolium]